MGHDVMKKLLSLALLTTLIASSSLSSNSSSSGPPAPIRELATNMQQAESAHPPMPMCTI